MQGLELRTIPTQVQAGDGGRGAAGGWPEHPDRTWGGRAPAQVLKGPVFHLPPQTSVPSSGTPYLENPPALREALWYQEGPSHQRALLFCTELGLSSLREPEQPASQLLPVPFHPACPVDTSQGAQGESQLQPSGARATPRAPAGPAAGQLSPLHRGSSPHCTDGETVPGRGVLTQPRQRTAEGWGLNPGLSGPSAVGVQEVCEPPKAKQHCGWGPGGLRAGPPGVCP